MGKAPNFYNIVVIFTNFPKSTKELEDHLTGIVHYLYNEEGIQASIVNVSVGHPFKNVSYFYSFDQGRKSHSYARNASVPLPRVSSKDSMRMIKAIAADSFTGKKRVFIRREIWDDKASKYRNIVTMHNLEDIKQYQE